MVNERFLTFLRPAGDSLRISVAVPTIPRVVVTFRLAVTAFSAVEHRRALRLERCAAFPGILPALGAGIDACLTRPVPDQRPLHC